MVALAIPDCLLVLSQTNQLVRLNEARYTAEMKRECQAFGTTGKSTAVYIFLPSVALPSRHTLRFFDMSFFVAILAPACVREVKKERMPLFTLLSGGRTELQLEVYQKRSEVRKWFVDRSLSAGVSRSRGLEPRRGPYEW